VIQPRVKRIVYRSYIVYSQRRTSSLRKDTPHIVLIQHLNLSGILLGNPSLFGMNHFAPSVAFFCPQSKAPTEAYLEQLQKYIVGTLLLQPFAQAITSLGYTWSTLCEGHADIAKLKSGERHVASLERWITDGIAGPVSSSMSGILALPLLVVIQICQYFQLLELHDLTHEQMLSSLRNGGGAQGYCGGLPTAFAVSCAKDEEDLVRLATKALRLAFAVGAFGELGDDESIEGATTIAVRLRASQQGDELVDDIPGVSRFRSFVFCKVVPFLPLRYIQEVIIRLGEGCKPSASSFSLSHPIATCLRRLVLYFCDNRPKNNKYCWPSARTQEGGRKSS
jgi:hypothetical protein